MTENEHTTKGQGLEPGRIKYTPKTTIQLDNETLGLLNECKGIEGQRRGGWLKHNDFIRFLCRLYKESQARDECKVILYLASKE
jgi:hypothetical protein